MQPSNQFIQQEDILDETPTTPVPASIPLISYEDEPPVAIREEEDGAEKAPTLSIKQLNMWKNYIDPKSSTYGNAITSAVKAGYADTTAHSITGLPFFKDKLRRLNMLTRAEKVLKKTLIMETKDKITGKEQADLLRIQVDAAKHITKTLGKDEGYSERSEVTGKDGSPIVFLPSELMEKYSIPTQSEDITNNKREQEIVNQNSSQEQEEGNSTAN